jgi:Skp family chaperone for outer membrane proteins
LLLDKDKFNGEIKDFTRENKEQYKRYMKSIRLIIATLVFAVAFVLPAYAQTGAGIKVAVIDTAQFQDEKQGIAKYITAFKQLETEFKPSADALSTIQQRGQTLAQEIEKLQNSPAPVAPETIRAKTDEYQKLQVDFKRKQEDLQAAYNKREAEVVGPVRQDIGNAMRDFMTQRGLDLIVDPNRDDKGFVIMWGPKADITDDFIKFYNTRPSTATTAKPATTTAKP